MKKVQIGFFVSAIDSWGEGSTLCHSRGVFARYNRSRSAGDSPLSLPAKGSQSLTLLEYKKGSGKKNKAKNIPLNFQVAPHLSDFTAQLFVGNDFLFDCFAGMDNGGMFFAKRFSQHCE